LSKSVGDTAEPHGFCLKSCPDAPLLIWAQLAVARFKQADFEPTDAGEPSYLAL